MVDVFKSIFFSRELKNKSFKKYTSLNIVKNLRNNNQKLSKKNILDLSDGIGLNNNNNIFNNNNNSLKIQSNKNITSDKSNLKRGISQLYTINDETIIQHKLIYFYLFPLWVLKKHKTFNNICLIKDRICSYFSVERLNELIRFKEHLDLKAKKLKINNTELIKVNKKFQDSNDSNEMPKSNDK